MTERGKNLADRPEGVIDEAIRHPRQLEMCLVIAGLIDHLRTCQTDADYMDFQSNLFAILIEEQDRQAEAARNEKRALTGKAPAPPDASSWEIERVVADRIVRQLRSVGDALAWRLFDFDRRVFVTFSMNNRIGPMIERKGAFKEGLAYETGFIQDFWEKEKRFGLLHDLTSSLRLGDVTLFTEEKPVMYEVTKNPSKSKSRQMKKLEAAVSTYNAGGPLVDGDGSETHVFRSKVPFRTRLGQLEEILALAARDGFGSVALAHHWYVTAVSLTSSSLPERFPIAEIEKREQKTAKKAQVGPTDHLCDGRYLDIATAQPYAPPYAVYPFEPLVCARLTCDLLIYRPFVTAERLANAFEDRGFHTEILLPERDEPLEWKTPVLRASKGGMGTIVHWGTMGQLLQEMLEVNAYAASVDEVLSSGKKLERGMVVFSNEKATWK